MEVLWLAIVFIVRVQSVDIVNSTLTEEVSGVNENNDTKFDGNVTFTNITNDSLLNYTISESVTAREDASTTSLPVKTTQVNATIVTTTPFVKTVKAGETLLSTGRKSEHISGVGIANFTIISQQKHLRRKQQMRHEMLKLAKERERDKAKEKARYFKEGHNKRPRVDVSELDKIKSKSTYDEKDANRPMKKHCYMCEQKRKQKEMEQNRIESLRAQLTKKLQTDLSSTRRMRATIPDILRQRVMRDQSDDDDDDGYARITDVLIFGHDITGKCKYHVSTGCYMFNLRNKVHGKVVSAELYLYKLHDRNDGQQSILISELERPKFRKLMPRNIVIRKETDVTEGWLSFRVDKTVKRWVENPYLNDGIAVRCKTCATQHHRHLYSDKDGYQPVIRVHVESRHNHRRQRRSTIVECGSRVNRCCRHNFYINFREANLFRIMNPEGIWANYCTGPCDDMWAGHYNHTSLLQSVRWHSDLANDTIREAIKPCCGAVRLKAITVLYLADNGDPTVAIVPDIGVLECGCL